MVKGRDSEASCLGLIPSLPHVAHWCVAPGVSFPICKSGVPRDPTHGTITLGITNTVILVKKLQQCLACRKHGTCLLNNFLNEAFG